MFFKLLNDNQNSIAVSCILVLGILQISVDSWTLYKIQEHEEVILFLAGTVSPNTMHDLGYDQAISYFTRLKRFLKPDLLEILDILQMTAILGIVAGILQLFSSTGALMWKGATVDVFWLALNFIASIFLSVAVAYISIHMIRDVPYHQALLTVTVVNLFILVHIWIVNLIAHVYGKCIGGNKPEISSNENLESAGSQSQLQANSNNSTRTDQENSHTNNGSTTVAR